MALVRVPPGGTNTPFGGVGLRCGGPGRRRAPLPPPSSRYDPPEIVSEPQAGSAQGGDAAPLPHLGLILGVVGGGTTYTKAVSGSLTASGLLFRRTAKRLLGSTTATSALRRLTRIRRAGSLTLSSLAGKFSRAPKQAGAVTGAGSVATVFQSGGPNVKATSGSITMTSTLSRRISKRVVGSITGTSLVTKKTLRKVLGSLTMASTLSRKVRVSRVGQIVATGLLDPSFTFKKAVAGAITAAGALTTLFQVGTGLPIVRQAVDHLRRYIGRR